MLNTNLNAEQMTSVIVAVAANEVDEKSVLELCKLAGIKVYGAICIQVRDEIAVFYNVSVEHIGRGRWLVTEYESKYKSHAEQELEWALQDA